MSEWKQYKVADLIERNLLLIGDGYRAKNSELYAISSTGIPFARVRNINEGFDFSEVDFYPPEHLDKLGAKISQVGDTVFTSKGTVGRFAFVSETTQQFVYSPQLCFWRTLDHKSIAPRFLFYWMQGGEFFTQVEAVKGQTDMADYVNLADQRQMKITLPPLPEQQAIAAVLSSLDDKIDLLHRQNKTLEALAQTLFRHWFADGAGDNWEVYSLYDAVDLIGGGTPKTSEESYWNGDICWLSGGDITSNHKNFVVSSEKKITKLGLNNSATKLLPKFSTVISARGTVGKYCILGEPMAFSQTSYGIQPKFDSCFFFTYLLIDHSVAALQSASYGSVFDTITTQTFKSHQISLPPVADIKSFEDQVTPYFHKMYLNQMQSRTLEKLRDTLLPKLMSGEVRVRL